MSHSCPWEPEELRYETVTKRFGDWKTVGQNKFRLNWLKAQTDLLPKSRPPPPPQPHPPSLTPALAGTI